MQATPEVMQKLFASRSSFPTPESRLKASNFTPRASDVIIATPPKSGTTWMQQIVHGLRSRGSMDFDDITDVIPFLEFSGDMEVDVEADQVAEPRVFKTHFSYDRCPKGAGRYIVVVRNPLDIFPSLFAFLRGWLFPEDALDMNTMVGFFLKAHSRVPEPGAGKPPSESFWEVIVSWWKRRNDENVLFLFYEDMLEDLAGTVKTVAGFIGCGADDQELQKLVVKQASREFMLAHVSKFGDYKIKLKQNKVNGLSDDAGTGKENAKVRSEKDGSRRAQLSPEIVKEINLRWKSLGEITESPSYEAFRMAYGARAGAN